MTMHDVSLDAAVAATFEGGPITITLHGARWDTRRAVTAGNWTGPLEDWQKAVEARARAITPRRVSSPLPRWAADLWGRAHAVAILAVAGAQEPITLRRASAGSVDSLGASTDRQICAPDMWVAALCEAAMRPAFPGAPGAAAWEPGPFEAA